MRTITATIIETALPGLILLTLAAVVLAVINIADRAGL